MAGHVLFDEDIGAFDDARADHEESCVKLLLTQVVQ